MEKEVLYGGVFFFRDPHEQILVSGKEALGLMTKCFELSKTKLLNEPALAFSEHPEYLLYVLKKKELEELLLLRDAPAGVLQVKPKQKTLEKWMCLGLVVFEPDLSGKSVTGYLSLTEECNSILSAVLSMDWKNRMRKHSILMAELECLLQIYFVIDMEQLLDIYRQILKCRDRLQTVSSTYQIYPKEQVELVKNDIKYMVKAWRELDYSLRNCELHSGQNISMCVRELYREVSTGLSFQKLITHLTALIPLQTAYDYFQIWDLAMEMSVTTPLAILYGYTRNDFADAYNVVPFQLSLFEPDRSFGYEKRELHLYELPVDEQQMLYFMFHSEQKEEDYFRLIELLIKDYDGNTELQLFYGLFCYYSGKKKKGTGILKKILAKKQLYQFQ